MVKITNGIVTFEVTRGAYDGIPSGFQTGQRSSREKGCR